MCVVLSYDIGIRIFFHESVGATLVLFVIFQCLPAQLLILVFILDKNIKEEAFGAFAQRDDEKINSLSNLVNKD